MGTIVARYDVSCSAADAPAVARHIAVEQTVEVPDALIDERIEAEIVGDVLSIEEIGEGKHAIRIAYDAGLAHGHLPQLLNLVFGNVSLLREARLAALDLPTAVLDRFPGPNFGIPGLRRLLGVAERPLLSTALKPRGLPVDELAAIAGAFAGGGGDLVKDDHNLIDDDLKGFRARVARCQAAVDEANAKTGNRCLYVANLFVPNPELERYLDAAWEVGVRGIMVPPLIAGLDAVRGLAADQDVVVVAHPSFSGALLQRGHGIDCGVLMGTLFRLAGVDVSIFVNSGGRFDYTEEECESIAHACRAPLGSLAPSFPSPAGGMSYDRVPEMVARFGPDTMLLVGGALLTHSDDVAASTRAFLDLIR